MASSVSSMNVKAFTRNDIALAMLHIVKGVKAECQTGPVAQAIQALQNGDIHPDFIAFLGLLIDMSSKQDSLRVKLRFVGLALRGLVFM